MTDEESRREFPVTRPAKAPVSHMQGTTMPGSRVPRPTMFLKPNEIIIEEPNTGRRMQDVNQIITEDMRDAILDGYMCLKCKEPFETPWPKECPVCGYAVSDRQVPDSELELVGTEHIGPSRPLSMFMEELEERARKREFDQKLNSGHSPMKGMH